MSAGAVGEAGVDNEWIVGSLMAWKAVSGWGMEVSGGWYDSTRKKNSEPKRALPAIQRRSALELTVPRTYVWIEKSSKYMVA